MGIVDSIKKNADKLGLAVGFLSTPHAANEMLNAISKIVTGGAHIPTEDSMRRLIDYPDVRFMAKAGIGLLVARELGIMKGIASPGVKSIGGYFVGRTINHALYWSVH